jgi:nitrate reductase molybdenum cofactor assembly chaperone NarJ/NarW
MRPWRLLSALLLYPTKELSAALEELDDAAAALPRSSGRAEIGEFLLWLRRTPLSGAQETYVETFDFGRRASLHLTYHSHGDRRQRGLELIRLKRRYAAAGFPLADTELPDYLPAMLEFAALAPAAHGEALLAEFRTSLELVRAELHDRASPYAGLLDALCNVLPKPTRAQLDALRKLAIEGPPTELVGLDPFTPPELEPISAS